VRGLRYRGAVINFYRYSPDTLGATSRRARDAGRALRARAPRASGAVWHHGGHHLCGRGAVVTVHPSLSARARSLSRRYRRGPGPNACVCGVHATSVQP